MTTRVLDRAEEEDVKTPYPLRQEDYFLEEEEQRDDFYLPLINVIVLTGLKGSTKTCNLVRFGMMAMAVWQRPVFSDFPFGGSLFGKEYEAQPFPDTALINYGEGLPAYPILILDEIQEFFDRQEWMSVKSKQSISLTQQIRKLGLCIFGACQFFHYLNPRLNDQVDILIRCQDMRFTPWGINEGIKRGREALLEWYDLSGAITGKSARNEGNYHYVSGEPYYDELVFTEPYWRFFDTRKLTAIEQRFRRYEMEKEVIKVGRGGVGKQEDKDFTTMVDLALTDIFDGLAADDDLGGAEIAKMLRADGFNVHASKISERLDHLGKLRKDTKRGTRYFNPPETEASEENKEGAE